MTAEVWPARGSMSGAPCSGLWGVSSPGAEQSGALLCTVLCHLQLSWDCWPCPLSALVERAGPPVEIFPVGWWESLAIPTEQLCTASSTGHDMIHCRRKCPHVVTSPLTICVFSLSAFNKTIALNHLTWIQELTSSSFLQASHSSSEPHDSSPSASV